MDYSLDPTPRPSLPSNRMMEVPGLQGQLPLQEFLNLVEQLISATKALTSMFADGGAMARHVFFWATDVSRTTPIASSLLALPEVQMIICQYNESDPTRRSMTTTNNRPHPRQEGDGQRDHRAPRGTTGAARATTSTSGVNVLPMRGLDDIESDAIFAAARRSYRDNHL